VRQKLERPLLVKILPYLRQHCVSLHLMRACLTIDR
jgi:hypothetical protein